MRKTCGFGVIAEPEQHNIQASFLDKQIDGKLLMWSDLYERYLNRNTTERNYNKSA